MNIEVTMGLRADYIQGMLATFWFRISCLFVSNLKDQIYRSIFNLLLYTHVILYILF
jgi:hypothetical protein